MGVTNTAKELVVQVQQYKLRHLPDTHTYNNSRGNSNNNNNNKNNDKGLMRHKTCPLHQAYRIYHNKMTQGSGTHLKGPLHLHVLN